MFQELPGCGSERNMIFGISGVTEHALDEAVCSVFLLKTASILKHVQETIALRSSSLALMSTSEPGLVCKPFSVSIPVSITSPSFLSSLCSMSVLIPH